MYMYVWTSFYTQKLQMFHILPNNAVFITFIDKLDSLGSSDSWWVVILGMIFFRLTCTETHNYIVIAAVRTTKSYGIGKDQFCL